MEVLATLLQLYASETTLLKAQWTAILEQQQ